MAMDDMHVQVMVPEAGTGPTNRPANPLYTTAVSQSTRKLARPCAVVILYRVFVLARTLASPPQLNQVKCGTPCDLRRSLPKAPVCKAGGDKGQQSTNEPTKNSNKRPAHRRHLPPPINVSNTLFVPVESAALISAASKVASYVASRTKQARGWKLAADPLASGIGVGRQVSGKKYYPRGEYAYTSYKTNKRR